MGRSPLDELAERWRGLQQGAGEKLGRLKRAAETFAASLDSKRKEEIGLRHDKQNEAEVAVESRVAKSVPKRQGRRGGAQGAHPIAAMSHTSRRVAGNVVVKERVLREIVPGERIEAAAVVGTRGEEDNTSAASHAREELGRSTWTLLHMLAAQYPEKPTKQQQKDVKSLMELMTRIYPCKLCADHFKDVLKAYPVQADSGFELAQWMCQVHNVVNRSLKKPLFPCQRVDARWGALNCDEDACSLEDRSIK